MLSHTQTMAFLEFNCEDVSFTLNPEYDSQARQQQIPRLRRNWFRAVDSDGIASMPRTICDIVSYMAWTYFTEYVSYGLIKQNLELAAKVLLFSSLAAGFARYERVLWR